MTIESDNGDGTYNARTVDTRALLRISRGFVTDTFAVGSRVLVQRPSGARNVVGALPVIISRGPQEQRGVSGSRPDETREMISAPTVTGVEPDPLVLQAGGAAQTHVIRGGNFTAPATYVALADGGDSPVVTDAEPPELLGRQVIMHVQADSESPVGEFDMVISGVRVPRALRITRPRVYGLLFVPGARVYGVDPERGRIVRQSELLPIATDRTFTIAPDTVVAFRAGGGATILNRELEQIVHYGNTIVPAVNEFSQMAYDGHGAIWYCSGNTLYRVGVETGVLTAIHTAAGAYEGVAYDAGADRVFACSNDVRAVRAYSRSGGALTATIAIPGGTTDPFYPRNLIIENGTWLMILCKRRDSSVKQGFVRVLLSSLAIVDQVDYNGAVPIFPTGAAFNARGQNLWPLRQATSSGTYTFAANGASRVGKNVAGVSEVLGVAVVDVFAESKFIYGGFLNHDQRLVTVGQSDDGLRLRLAVWDAVDTEVTEANSTVYVDPAVPSTPRPCGYLRI
jgi:hypothetical protein